MLQGHNRSQDIATLATDRLAKIKGAGPWGEGGMISAKTACEDLLGIFFVFRILKIALSSPAKPWIPVRRAT